jgi:predicted metal-dependent peptidase
MEQQHRDQIDAIKNRIARVGIKNEERVADLVSGLEKAFEDPKRVASGTLPELTDEFIDGAVEWLREEDTTDEIEPLYVFNRRLIDSLTSSVFFAELSRWIRKIPSVTLPTMGVGYNSVTEDVELHYNRRFSCRLTPGEHKGVLRHEFYHIIFKHITTRRLKPHVVGNIAQDLCINSIIEADGCELPAGLYLPGKRPDAPKYRKMTDDEKKVHESFADLIENLPKMLTSEVYYNILMQWAKDNGQEWGKGGLRSCSGTPDGSDDPDNDGEGSGGILQEGDVHDKWDEMTEEEKKALERKVKEMTRKAAKKADSVSNGWGNMPAEIREQIRAAVFGCVDWKEVLKNFIGMQNRGARSASIKRINRRYPYVHPGTRRSYLPKILVAIDQSGSVSDENLAAIFAVLGTLSKRVTFSVVNFDYTIDENSLRDWKHGQKIDLDRTRGGGTSFEAVTDFVNKPENRGKWDGVIIATDGECSQPSPTLVRRAWLIVPGKKLAFETNELVISMDNNGIVLQPNGSVR